MMMKKHIPRKTLMIMNDGFQGIGPSGTVNAADIAIPLFATLYVFVAYKLTT